MAPEADAAVIRRRLLHRGLLYSLTAVPELTDLADTAGGRETACADGDVSEYPQAADWVWGMRWYILVPSCYASVGGQSAYGPIKEYELVPAANPGLASLGGSFALRRQWFPNQSADQGERDVAYANRDTRIDWWGPLRESNWLRGQSKCLDYVVSDADIYVVGRYGERWYEPARGFQRIELWIDGTLRETKTVPNGTFCIDTAAYANGTHTLTLKAYVNDGAKTVTESNERLRIDNQAPTATGTGPGTYSKETVTVAGGGVDAHSGPKDAELQIRPSGGAWRSIACTTGAAGSPGAGAYTCNWKTNGGAYPDGTYDAQLHLRDQSSDGGNEAYFGAGSTTVDNTLPSVENTAPDIYEEGYEAANTAEVEIAWTQHDTGSGIGKTTVQVDSATDGGEPTWQDVGSSSAEGDASVLWNPGKRPGGLTRFRTLACDRAGNCAERQWQGVIAARREPSPRQRANGAQSVGCDPAKEKFGNARCYAGSDDVGNAPGSTSFGIEAEMATPATIKYQGASDWSAAWVGMGPAGIEGSDNRQLQTGITTPDNHSCPHKSRPPVRIDNELRDRWYTFREYIDADGKQWLRCGVGPLQFGAPPHTYKTEVYRTGNVLARVFIDGKVVGLRMHGQDRKKFRLGRSGTAGTAAQGEVNDVGRQMGGIFKFVTANTLAGDLGGYQPAAGTLTADRGYIASGQPSKFCVADRGRGCTPP